MALSDLLSGRTLDDMLESIPRLWELCFRVRDDIKVREKFTVCLTVFLVAREGAVVHFACCTC